MAVEEDVITVKVFGSGYKMCCRCHQEKPKSEFYKKARAKDGLSPFCIDCEKLYKLHRKMAPKEHIAQKRCRVCNEVKLRDEFNTDRNSRDGLTSKCRACVKVAYQNRKPVAELPESKQCSTCGIVRPQNEFDKKKESPDGLRSYCKHCRNLNMRVHYIIKRALRFADKHQDLGIADWSQADSVVRQMAELQVAINKEKELCDKRIELAKKETAEVIKPYVLHQGKLRLMLESFIVRTRRNARKMVKQLQFGVVTFYRWRMDVILNVDLAKQRMDKL